MTAELHRLVRLDRIRPEGEDYQVTATAAERRGLAERMAIPAVLDLECRFALRRLPGGVVAAAGQLLARVTRTCVVTLDEFDTVVTEDFTVRFVPEGTESTEFDPEAEDEIPYSGDVIDLGDAAAEQLALALDPYPRRPDAELAVGTDQSAPHPFAGLEALRRRH